MDRLTTADLIDTRWRLEAAWRRMNPDQGDDEMPDLIRNSEPMKRRDVLTAIRDLLARHESTEPDPDPDPATPAGGAALPVPRQHTNANAVDLSTFASRTGRGRLFIDLRNFAEAPDWVMVIPAPNVFEHPWYGTIVITAERNARFVANFEQRVYGQDLPVDAEHETQLSGAFGWIRELRAAEGNAVEARIEWTERGLLAFEKEAFRYVSPSWFEWWEQPMTGAVYQDVLVGLALTNNPFFKESSLPPLYPLVASETGLSAPEGAPSWMAAGRAGLSSAPNDPNGSTTIEGAVQMPEVKDTNQAVALTEADVTAFREWQANRETEATRFTEMQDQITSLNEAKATLEAANATAAREAMVRRFTDEVRGRSDANGSAWLGSVENNVATLVALAEAHGEDSELFTNHVANGRAVAKQAADSKLFSAVGSTDGATGDEDESAEAHRLASERAKSDGIDYAAALRLVFRERPDLYAAHRKATAAR